MKQKYNGRAIPQDGKAIEFVGGKFVIPDRPIIPFIEGDGTGRDIWKASRRVFDSAVEQAYGGKRKIAWFEVFAGEKAFNEFKQWLPDETVEAVRDFRISIKGPLTTPVGGGIRSLRDARAWIDCGAERIVVGTAVAESPELLCELVETFGAERIVPAVDVRDGAVRVAGWQRSATESLQQAERALREIGVTGKAAFDALLNKPFPMQLPRGLVCPPSLSSSAKGGNPSSPRPRRPPCAARPSVAVCAPASTPRPRRSPTPRSVRSPASD